MSYELVINSSSDEVVTALLYENKLVDLHALIWIRYGGYLEDTSEPLKTIQKKFPD